MVASARPQKSAVRVARNVISLQGCFRDVATALVYMAFYFSTVIAVAYIIFSPFRLIATTNPAGGFRFQLADIFAAFLPFQFGFAALNWILPDIKWHPSLAIAVGMAIILTVAAAWIYGLRLLSRMHVNSGLKRIVFLGIVMPVGFVVSATAFLVPLSAESVLQVIIQLAIVIAVVLSLRGLAVWVCPQATFHFAPIPSEEST